jgi:hypothetical protein
MGEGEGESELDSDGDVRQKNNRHLKWKPPILDPDLIDDKSQQSDIDGTGINFGASDDSQNQYKDVERKKQIPPKIPMTSAAFEAYLLHQDI